MPEEQDEETIVSLPIEGSDVVSFYRSSSYLINKINNYFAKKAVSDEYFESYHNISLIFDLESEVLQYDMYKNKPCVTCRDANCRCFCMDEGRFRRLEISNYIGDVYCLDKFEEDTLVVENSADGRKGKIEFSSKSSKESFIINTKLIWVWCKKSFRQGEFDKGAREQLVSKPRKKLTCDPAIGVLIQEAICE